MEERLVAALRVIEVSADLSEVRLGLNNIQMRATDRLSCMSGPVRVSRSVVAGCRGRRILLAIQ